MDVSQLIQQKLEQPNAVAQQQLTQVLDLQRFQANTP